MHHHADLDAVAEMCLGVLTAVGVVVAVAGLALMARGGGSRVLSLDRCRVQRTARPVQPRTRAGPALLVLLCVSRR
jgi:hypothetical protein